MSSQSHAQTSSHTNHAPRSSTGAHDEAAKAQLSVSAEAIAQRAYEKFLARDGAHGHDQEDWLSSESELLPQTRH